MNHARPPILSRALAALALLALPVFLAACGDSGPTPDEVTAAYMAALIQMDPQAMADQACPELAGEILASREALEQAAGMDMMIDLSGLVVEVVSEGEEEAFVRLKGPATWAGMEEQVDEELRLVRVDGQWKLCEPFR